MAERSNLVEQLQHVPLFSACSKSDLKIVARHALEVNVPSDTILVHEGEPGDSFYVVLEGTAAVRRKGGQSRSRRVTTLGPGGFFGELALLDPAPRNATVAALGPMRVAALDRRAFRALLRDVPALSERLLAGVARRLRDADLKTYG